MRILLIFAVVLGLVMMAQAWEEFLIPMMIMQQQQQQQRQAQFDRDPTIYDQPVGSEVGWQSNRYNGYRQPVVKDAQWYDNNT